MKKIRIGLIGFGTVGSGLYRLLEQNAAIIERRTGIRFEISSICDLRAEDVKNRTKGVEVITDWQEIIADPKTDIVAELIGGIEPAKSIVLAALKAGKGVVTANKKLLAEEGGEIFAASGAGSGRLGIEASVGGGIPCIMALRHGLVGNRVKSIMGILNGTTNYILTSMQENNLPFADALKDAQDRGFAEADPTFDIEGFDAGHKITLLAMIAFNRQIQFKDVPIGGIAHIDSIDIVYARDMGYVIKLLGIAKETEDGSIDIRVHPTMIPGGHHLASVWNEYNSIMFDCNMTDPVILTGKGAGAMPTASAVLADIVQISLQGDAYQSPLITDGAAQLIEPGKRMSRYYIRMQTDDRPGLLSQIAGVLGKNNISISSVIQKEVHTENVPLVFMTHEAAEEGMLAAILEIKNFDFVHGEIMLIRVEDSLSAGEQK
ncbi:MAG: homoserine dehydrogenase [Spirochaetes bacterium]|nr:homoserine dehydrogenase [Spirochaetota bacterium]